MRPPRRAEVRQLEHLIVAAEHPAICRRAQAVLLCAAGCEATLIAAALAVHPNTIYTDLRAFAHRGVAGLSALGQAQRAGSFTQEQRARILELAQTPPDQLALPWGRWSLAKLRAYLIQHHVLRAISREHLRRLLKKGACGSAGPRKSSAVLIPVAGRFWPGFAGFGSSCPRAGTCSSSM
jgi:transposase